MHLIHQRCGVNHPRKLWIALCTPLQKKIPEVSLAAHFSFSVFSGFRCPIPFRRRWRAVLSLAAESAVCADARATGAALLSLARAARWRQALDLRLGQRNERGLRFEVGAGMVETSRKRSEETISFHL